MISKITHLELDLTKFPFDVVAFNGKILLKKWTFQSESEAKKALSEMSHELLKYKKKSTTN